MKNKSKPIDPKFISEFEDAKSASIEVTAESNIDSPNSRYKIYIDGNIVWSSFDPRECVWFKSVLPGKHEIVARDFDHLDPHRRESNLVTIEMTENQSIALRLFEIESKIHLHVGG